MQVSSRIIVDQYPQKPMLDRLLGFFDTNQRLSRLVSVESIVEILDLGEGTRGVLTDVVPSELSKLKSDQKANHRITTTFRGIIEEAHTYSRQRVQAELGLCASVNCKPFSKLEFYQISA